MTDADGLACRFSHLGLGIESCYFCLQGFAKSLLDVADNLARATGAVPEQFRKASFDGGSEADKALRSLLKGVDMTENQLQQVRSNRHSLRRYACRSGSIGVTLS